MSNAWVQRPLNVKVIPPNQFKALRGKVVSIVKNTQVLIVCGKLKVDIEF